MRQLWRIPHFCKRSNEKKWSFDERPLFGSIRSASLYMLVALVLLAAAIYEAGGAIVFLP
jgi:hypothetical protein